MPVRKREFPLGIALIATALVLALPAVSLAHDFWIEPSAFHPDPGELLQVRLRLGPSFHEGQAVVRDRSHMDRFIDLTAEAERPIVGLDGHDPAGVLRVREPGLHVIGYQSRATAIELKADVFTAYLRQEGLERVIESRAARGERDLPGRERFARCAKCLVLVGDDHAGFDRRMGFTLEIVPIEDPLVSGDAPTGFEVLYAGEPCAGIQVMAVHQSSEVSPRIVRTDDLGRIRIKLDQDGVWMLKAVHMVPDESPLSAADWLSFWASLTLQRGTGSPLNEPQARPDHLRADSTQDPPLLTRSPRTLLEWRLRLQPASDPPSPRR